MPRFVCKTCKRGFSRQTFRHDRYDKRPHENAEVFFQLVSGVGMRQVARARQLSPKSVQRKLRKLARTLWALHDNLTQKLPEGRTWLLDEEETFEAASIRALTMPVLIERETWLVVAAAVGSIRRLAPPGTARRARQDAEEAEHGQRPDTSSQVVRAVLQRLHEKVPTGRIVLRTDQKPSYGPIAREVFGDRLIHETTAGSRARDTSNPLFAINTTMAMTRDNCGRLRRRSWLVSKCGTWLQDHMGLFTAYRNYVRRRFNYDEASISAAVLVGLLPRRLTRDEALAWRQDWAERSIHPMSRCGAECVGDAMAA
ncbi:MAG: hypothetical protein JNL08_18460 [Planctomycetes bacterium]|nr:hypothetical protein [Planctomycetota bacterium]